MYRTGLIVGFILLFVAALPGCKKNKEKPPWADKKENAAKPAQEKTQGVAKPEEAPEEEPEAEVKAEPDAGPLESAPDAQADNKEEESPVDKASCKDRIAREEARIRRDVIPTMREEEEAGVAMTRWIRRTFETLEESHSDLSKERIGEYWEEYEACLKQMRTPQAQRDPECVAYVTADESACTRLGSEDLRKRCVDTVQTKAWEKNVYDWARSGFSAEFCTGTQSGPATHQIRDEFCRLISEGGSCKTPAASSHMVKMCKAAQAGLKGWECGGDFPEGSPYCEWLIITRSDDRASLCKEAVKQGKLDIYSEDCDNIKQVVNMNCDQAAVGDEPSDAEAKPDADCLFVMGLKNHKNDCTQAGIDPTSDDCSLYMSFVAALNNTPDVCKALPDERAQMRCRTFLSVEVKDCELKTDKEWGTGPKDDGPCRKLLFERKILPATEGRVELRLTLLNPFTDPARCTMMVEVVGKSQTARKTVEVALAGAESKVLQEYFLAEDESTFTVEPTCTWERAVPTPEKLPEEPAP